MMNKKSWAGKLIRLHATVVRIDRNVTKALVLNKQASARAKQIGLKYYYIKVAIKGSIIDLQDCDSSEKTANMLIKILDIPTLQHLSKNIQIS